MIDHRAANALYQLKQYARAIPLLEKGLTHHAGNADLLALLREVCDKMLLV